MPVQALSINKAFQGRRFKTKECKEFEHDFFILLPDREKIMGWVEVWYEYGLKKSNFAISDVGNLEKLISDLLVKKGYIEDDRKIIALHQKKTLSDFSFVRVKIVPFDETSCTIFS